MSDRGSLFRSSYRISEVLAVRRVWLAAESRRPPVIDRTPTSNPAREPLHPVRQNDRFSELSADRVFSLQNRLLAVRNTRLEKQSSIYSRQMSKLNSLCFVRTGFNGIPTRARHPSFPRRPDTILAILSNVSRSGCFRAVLK
jgi:hypothetical protein